MKPSWPEPRRRSPHAHARRRAIASTGLGLLLSALLGLSACGEPSAQAANSRRLVVTGSSTLGPLVAELAKRFEQRNPDVRIDVQTGGSSRGIADVRQGLADVGMVSRGLGSDEADLSGHTIALDGVAILAHASNPLDELSEAQVFDVFTGRVRNWSEIGGADAEITVVHKAEGRSTREVFLHHFGIDTRQAEASIVIGDNEHGVKSIAGNPHAIGYVSIGAAEVSVSRGTPIKLLALGGVPAASETVASGRFPLARELNLVTNAEPSTLATEFIGFTRSPEVRGLFQEYAFVPVD